MNENRFLLMHGGSIQFLSSRHQRYTESFERSFTGLNLDTVFLPSSKAVERNVICHCLCRNAMTPPSMIKTLK